MLCELFFILKRIELCLIENDLHSRTGRGETKGKTQESMERGRRKIEKVSDRQEQLEGRCSTGKAHCGLYSQWKKNDGKCFLFFM
jgi:hypothetical protein